MQEHQADKLGPVYSLNRRRIAEEAPEKYVWVVESGYRTPPPTGEPPLPVPNEFETLYAMALRAWVSVLPPRSKILFTHNIGGRRLPSRQLPTDTELMLADFRAFCQSESVFFMALKVAI